MSSLRHQSDNHPVDDGGPDFLVDPGTAANIVSTLLQIILALIGPEKAKAALDWETKAATNVSAELSKAATDAAALAILRSRGIL